MKCDILKAISGRAGELGRFVLVMLDAFGVGLKIIFCCLILRCGNRSDRYYKSTVNRFAIFASNSTWDVRV